MSEHTHDLEGSPDLDHAALHAQGIPHTHDHTHGGHGHHHSAEHIRQISNRLARAIGHLESVKKMVEEDRDCAEVLIQLAAVRSALTSTGKLILQDHLEHCIVDAIEQGDREPVDQLMKAIEQFVK